MKNIHIAFYTEAGSSRGMGHLIRSYTIYRKFKTMGISASFFLDSDICYDDKFNDITYFTWKNFKLDTKFSIVFIDSYEATIDIYKSISKQVKVAVYIDDYNRLEYPKGVILNFAPDAKELFFKERSAKHKYLLGLKYIPIRDEFLHVDVEKKKQIFIMLGGSDVANLSLEIVQVLQDINIEKVIVSNNKNTLQKLNEYQNVRILYKPKDSQLVTEMAQSSMAISTASMSVYELAYLNIPTIIIAVAKNQEVGVSQFIKYKLVSSYVSIKDDIWHDALREKTKKLLDKKKYNINNIIDGKGIQNIINETMELIK